MSIYAVAMQCIHCCQVRSSHSRRRSFALPMRLPSPFVPPVNAPAGPGRAKLGRGEAAPRSDCVWLRPRLAPVCSGPVIANCPENAEERSISEEV